MDNTFSSVSIIPLSHPKKEKAYQDYSINPIKNLAPAEESERLGNPCFFSKRGIWGGVNSITRAGTMRNSGHRDEKSDMKSL